ncbi:helix-turn-helix domain-containing protein [Bacillus cereus]
MRKSELCLISDRFRGSRADAAKKSGISCMTLYRKIQQKITSKTQK